jgi:hypothetical protein
MVGRSTELTMFLDGINPWYIYNTQISLLGHMWTHSIKLGLHVVVHYKNELILQELSSIWIEKYRMTLYATWIELNWIELN